MIYDWQDSVYISYVGFDGDGFFKLMQYTGLKDKNGKEIYEGDIVKGTGGEFNEEVWEAGWNEDRDFIGWSITPQNCEDGLEIIGNIYENPELCHT